MDELSAEEFEKLRAMFPEHNEHTLRRLPADWLRRQLSKGEALRKVRAADYRRRKALCSGWLDG